MDTVLIFAVPFIGVFGVIVGALLQALLTRRNQKSQSPYRASE
ncbi:hypothetical protein [Vibrio parahaemolyticus]|nr:hypothetical protein [Vibrio parahaemolyticus]